MAGSGRTEKHLNYYRGNRSFEDVLKEEFAFSLIFNNVAPNRMAAALQSVGLSKMPNAFLLIQVDDYSNESKRFSVENEFVMKVRILNIVRSLLAKSRWEHFAANLTGTDNMIALFCVDEKENYEEGLSRISQEICEKVHRFADYTVSICISELCRKVSQFSKNYERANAVLQESFFLGRKLQTKIISTPENEKQELMTEEIDRYIQSVYASLSKGDRVLFGQTMVHFFEAVQKSRRNRERSQILAGKMVDKMGEYILACGVENKSYVDEKTACAKEAILSCRYADDICMVLMNLYEELWELLDRLRGRSLESVFQEMVQQYIKDHFREKIYLDEIAASCGYSRHYFCKRFKKCFDMSLSDKINRLRVEQAKELLCGGYQTIEEIAYEIGFSSANYFEIVFRKSTGISPTAYRKMNSESV